ncbi:hypothetical protein CIB84_015639 [Bambusicola thoracicus]|uniref:Uncharacterized protein n=1 Tax=Bambusicola thoracicus TaxID=9083 RepID=A0A2P4S910_BAMTH|nr:hypothetical protein CIB84_015639 [Bambusicola thoracicus]
MHKHEHIPITVDLF